MSARTKRVKQIVAALGVSEGMVRDLVTQAAVSIMVTNNTCTVLLQEEALRRLAKVQTRKRRAADGWVRVANDRLTTIENATDIIDRATDLTTQVKDMVKTLDEVLDKDIWED